MILKFEDVYVVSQFVGRRLAPDRYRVYLKHGRYGMTLAIEEINRPDGHRVGLQMPLELSEEPKGVRVKRVVAITPLGDPLQDQSVFQRAVALNVTIQELLEEHRHPLDRTGEYDARALREQAEVIPYTQR